LAAHPRNGERSASVLMLALDVTVPGGQSFGMPGEIEARPRGRSTMTGRLQTIPDRRTPYPDV